MLKLGCWKRSRFENEGRKFSFGHVVFDIPLQLSSWNVRQSLENRNLEPRGEVWVGDNISEICQHVGDNSS